MPGTTIVSKSIIVSDFEAFRLEEEDNLIVNEGVFLAARSPNDGVVALGQNHITLNGTVSGDSGVTAIGSVRLTIGDNGRASGGYYGVELQSGGFIDNHGAIVGGPSAVYLKDSSTIVNTGSIISVGGNGAIDAQVSGADYRLKNSGLIKGPSDYGYSYDSPNSAIDHITNTGTMIGEVSLGAGNDAYSGRSGHVRGTVYGNAGNDLLEGGTEANRLSGGAGLDRLFGGTGNDTFIFETSPTGKTKADHVKDFANQTGNNDRFELSSSGLGAFTKLQPGPLPADAFAPVTSPKDTVGGNAHILYDRAHGALYYDTNGGDASGRLKFAVLDNHAALTASDFFVV